MTTLDKGPPGRTPRLFDVAGEVLPITAPGTQKEKPEMKTLDVARTFGDRS